MVYKLLGHRHVNRFFSMSFKYFNKKKVPKIVVFIEPELHNYYIKHALYKGADLRDFYVPDTRLNL